jgi:hypothetical protein
MSHSASASHPGSQGHDRSIAAAIFLFVLAVYILTYTGAFKSNDERALFSGTDSFVKRGDFTVNQIYWDYTHVGMLTTAGDMVPNYEPAQMIAAIPLYLWGRALDAAVQGVMFFGAVVMAASVALVYLCLLELDYSRRASALGSLIYAFATMAWPYSRTFFREPLTALAYLLAVYGLLRYRPPARRGLLWPAVTGAALGLALTTKQISVALIPTLLLLVVPCERHRPGTAKERIGAALVALVPLGIILLLSRLYTMSTLGGVQLFARDIVDYTTNPQLSQSVPIRMLRAFIGLTISPYKGFLWYSPVLLLGLVGAIPFTRRYLWEGLAFLTLVGVHLLGYSRYNYWSGGVAWGSRYMLPVVPFLVILAAPVWAWLARDLTPLSPPASAAKGLFQEGGQEVRLRLGRGILAGLVLLLVAISIVVQVLGISIDLRTYELKFLLDEAKIWGGIGEAIEARYMNPAYSPVLGHLRLLLSGTQPLDFAWVQWRQEGTWALVPAGLVLSLLLVGLALGGLIILWRRPARRRAATGRVGVAALIGGLGVATIVICSLLLTIYRRGDARFDPYGVERFLKPMTVALDDVSCSGPRTLGKARCNDALLVPDPLLTDYFLNHLRAPLVWYALEPRPVDTVLVEQLLSRYGRIWLARDRNAEADDAEDRRAWERYLTEHAYKLDEQRFGDWARLLRFSAAGRAAEAASPGKELGEFTLEHFTLGMEDAQLSPTQIARGAVQSDLEPLDDGKVQARPGDTLQVGLRWRANRQPEANYTAFVQLLDDQSRVRAQLDRWPGDGLYPTAALAANQVITDNLALPLEVPPGDYRLITGLYRGDTEGLPRLEGPEGDFITLAEVNVR